MLVYKDSIVGALRMKTAPEAMIDLANEVLDRRQHIEAALAYTEGTHTFDDIYWMIVSGRLVWWPLEDSFMVTEVVEYPQAKHYNVFLAGGDLRVIKAQQDKLVEAAKLAGCSELSLSGRRGWIKALYDLGWKESHTTASFHIPAENPDGQEGRKPDDHV